jgi:hypothetical protein
MMLKNALEHYKTVIKIKGRLRTLGDLEHLGTQGSQRSKEWLRHDHGTVTGRGQ